MLSTKIIEEFFAWAPLTILVVILAVAYFLTRTQPRISAPLGKTYSCARCGRRGVREHMVPVTHESAVVWYCGHCAQIH